jgi:hypothetical protein
MERNKYREQIQNNVCMPSGDSWGKLDKKLTDDDNRKKNNKQLLIKYVASALIIISISSYFFQTENKITSDEIIASPKIEKTSVRSTVTNPETDVYPASPIENSSEIKMMETNSPINEKNNYKVNERLAIKNEDSIEKDKNSQRVYEYLATIPLSENSKDTQHYMGTEAEVDVLLKNATLNIEKNDRYFTKSEISALDLLGEIEDVLEKDSRRKLFEKIIITIKNPTEIEITDRSK